MGGTDEPSNLFECSVEEHAELHFALYLEHGCIGDWVAFHMLSGITPDIEEHRQMLIRDACEGGKHLDEAAREKMRQAKLGTNHTEQTKQKMSAQRRGTTKSAEWKEKIRQSVTADVKRRKSYKITYTSGVVEEISGMKTWCRENGYNASQLRLLLNDKIQKGCYRDIKSVEEI